MQINILTCTLAVLELQGTPDRPRPASRASNGANTPRPRSRGCYRPESRYEPGPEYDFDNAPAEPELGTGSSTFDDEEEDDDEMMSPDMEPLPTNGKKGNKKPETEEEKRRNFLERNRQGISFPVS